MEIPRTTNYLKCMMFKDLPFESIYLLYFLSVGDITDTVKNNTDVRKMLLGDNNVIITPCKCPPKPSRVRKWLHDQCRKLKEANRTATTFDKVADSSETKPKDCPSIEKQTSLGTLPTPFPKLKSPPPLFSPPGSPSNFHFPTPLPSRVEQLRDEAGPVCSTPVGLATSSTFKPPECLRKRNEPTMFNPKLVPSEQLVRTKKDGRGERRQVSESTLLVSGLF